jgi:hypothetical protein
VCAPVIGLAQGPLRLQVMLLSQGVGQCTRHTEHPKQHQPASKCVRRRENMLARKMRHRVPSEGRVHSLPPLRVAGACSTWLRRHAKCCSWWGRNCAQSRKVPHGDTGRGPRREPRPPRGGYARCSRTGAHVAMQGSGDTRSVPLGGVVEAPGRMVLQP